jgi:5'(3')-deoxyribonucleotidase
MVPPLGKALKEKYGTPTFNTNDFWRKIDEAGQWFWDGLEAMPWQSELLALVESITDDWFIVSAPSWCPSSFSGKVKYLKRVFGKRFDRFLLTPHKTLFANESAVLIDDRESNIQKFVEAGGEGILFPTYHNCLHEKRDDPMSFIREKLEEVCCALQV